MGHDRETRELLIKNAMSEFLDKGYMKASLRKICSDAGVTTGALYFFFKDKEALFGAIVEKPLLELMAMLKEHFNADESLLEMQDAAYDFGEHENIAEVLVRHLYGNFDAFILLLTKAQGSCYEDCVDRIVDMVEQAYIAMAKKLAAHHPGMRVNTYMTHWLTHSHIDAFVHLLTHEPDEAKALKQMKIIIEFLVRSWTEMILIPDQDELK